MAKPYAVITGGSSGIGLKTAEALARQGRNILLMARSEDKLIAAAEQVKQAGDVEVRTIAADIQDLPSIEVAFMTLKDVAVDVLVNNAGLALGKSRFAENDFEDVEQMIQTNITGLLKVTHLLLPKLIESKGHIVNLSSIAGREAYEGGLVYCGTKAFVKMISKGLRIDVAGTGIRVTDIAPGAVETNFSNVRFKGDTERAAKVYAGWQPLQPEDIADCIAFAVSRPAHVNIDEMLIMPTQQASAGRVAK